MARNIIAITLALWFFFFMFCAGVARMPGLALLPLYGLYPGEVASGEAGYNPTEMHAWAIGAGILFLVLLFFGAVYEKKSAAITFMILFIISTVISCARISGALHSIH